MFLTRYCRRMAVETFVKDVINDPKLSRDVKILLIANAKKIIKKKSKEIWKEWKKEKETIEV